MSETTKIEWCDATLNLWWGCTKVSLGCKNCYAEVLSDERYKNNCWGPTGIRKEVKSWRSILNKTSKQALKEGRRLRVFCSSMCDVFEGPETMGGENSENWQTVSRLREELLKAIESHPELDFLVLTKRPENVLLWGPTMREWVTEGFPPNLWLGTSVEDQKTADERIPHLLNIPAKIRFLSCEPLIGPVMLDRIADDEIGANWNVLDCGIHWVICGGESQRGCRPMNVAWARSLRIQCEANIVPFFMKQGSQANWPNFKDFDSFPADLQVREFPEVKR